MRSLDNYTLRRYLWAYGKQKLLPANERLPRAQKVLLLFVLGIINQNYYFNCWLWLNSFFFASKWITHMPFAHRSHSRHSQHTFCTMSCDRMDDSNGWIIAHTANKINSKSFTWNEKWKWPIIWHRFATHTHVRSALNWLGCVSSDRLDITAFLAFVARASNLC